MIKPILFSTPMVQAILRGEKTVTRRLISPQHLRVLESPYRKENPDVEDATLLTKLCLPPYSVGDTLYVREAWAVAYDVAGFPGGVAMAGAPQYVYRADGADGLKWRPSIHMPKAAARVFLRVTDVRAEQLQESFFCHGATVRNLAAEGIDIGDQCRECIETYGSPCCVDAESECGILDDVRDDFAKLWNSTINPADLSRYGWAADPWVWANSFERLTDDETRELVLT